MTRLLVTANRAGVRIEGSCCGCRGWRARVFTDELDDLRLGFLKQLQQPVAHRPRRSRRLRLHIQRAAEVPGSGQLRYNH